MTREEKYWLNHKIINGILHRKCGGECKEWKPETQEYYYFKNISNSKQGYSSECKICSVERSKRHHLANPDYKKNNNKIYYEKDKEIVKRRKKINKAKNPEKYKNKYKKWIEKNKDKISNYNENRRHKNHNITKTEWIACKEYFKDEDGDYCCAYCGLKIQNHTRIYSGKIQYIDLHKEHVIHNGTNDLSNCIPSCGGCNDKKWEFLLDEFYNEENPDYAEAKYNKIMQWTLIDCYQYIEEKKPRKPYVKKIMSSLSGSSVWSEFKEDEI